MSDGTPENEPTIPPLGKMMLFGVRGAFRDEARRSVGLLGRVRRWLGSSRRERVEDHRQVVYEVNGGSVTKRDARDYVDGRDWTGRGGSLLVVFGN